MRKPHRLPTAIPPLAASAACFALLVAPLLAGRFYLYDDLLTFHLPLRVFYSRCLAAGDDFRWFPGYFCGLDLHGEGQIGLLHPLHLALYATFAPAISLPVEFTLNYAVAFLGWALFLRRWASTPAAIAGALGATFFGYNLLHFMHINAVAIAAHLPWNLWLADRLFRAEQAPGPAPGVGLALLTGSALLMGYPQTFWCIKLVEAAYVGLLMLTSRKWSRLAPYLAYSAIGAGLGAVQLLPTWETLQGSRRATLGRERALMGSLHPMNLTQIAAPYAFLDRYVPTRGGLGLNRFVRLHELGVYQGAMLPPLLIYLFLGRRQLDSARRGLALWALLVAAAGLLIAFGDYGPLGGVIVRTPIVRSFRVPARYLLLTHAAGAVLMALAVDLLTRGPAPPRRRLAWLALAPAITLGSVASAHFWARLDPGAAPPLGTISRVGFNLLLVSAAAGSIALATRRPALGLSALLAIAVADFATYGLYFHLRDKMPRLAGAVSPASPSPRSPPASAWT